MSVSPLCAFVHKIARNIERRATNHQKYIGTVASGGTGIYFLLVSFSNENDKQWTCSHSHTLTHDRIIDDAAQHIRNMAVQYTKTFIILHANNDALVYVNITCSATACPTLLAAPSSALNNERLFTAVQYASLTQ